MQFSDLCRPRLTNRMVSRVAGQIDLKPRIKSSNFMVSSRLRCAAQKLRPPRRNHLPRCSSARPSTSRAADRSSPASCAAAARVGPSPGQQLHAAQQPFPLHSIPAHSSEAPPAEQQPPTRSLRSFTASRAAAPLAPQCQP